MHGGDGFVPEASFVHPNSYVLSQTNFGPKFKEGKELHWLRGGPRKKIFFSPHKVKAAILTAGGKNRYKYFV